MVVSTLRKRLQDLKRKIDHASSENPVQLLVITKKQSIEAIREIYMLGERCFGENYVQELVQKVSCLPNDIRWTFIGHLQSNKCGKLLTVPNLERISTVDSLQLAAKLQSTCEKLNRTVQVMIQINVDDEESKQGIGICHVRSLAYYIVTFCKNLFFCGFFVISPTNATQQEIYKCFQTTAALRQEACSSWNFIRRPQNLQVSMGMSNDLDIALQWKTDQVRIGQALFGPRSENKKV